LFKPSSFELKTENKLGVKDLSLSPKTPLKPIRTKYNSDEVE